VIVLEASAVADLLLGTERAASVEALVFGGESLHAPELLDVEVAFVLRRAERREEIGPRRAREALADLRDLPVYLYGPRPLLDRVWALRRNFTPADALYTSLAEALGVRLLTTDERLARAARRHSRAGVVPR
jgi:predicted nucleic acid-binding protein